MTLTRQAWPPRRLVLGIVPRHGVEPNLGAVIVEHQRRILRYGEPIAARNLIVELRGRPSGIAESDQALARSMAEADVAQHIGSRRQRDMAVDVNGIGAAVLGVVDDNFFFRDARATEKDPHRALHAG